MYQENEKKYPIYHICVTWEEKPQEGKDYSSWEILPNSNLRNSTCKDQMFTKETTQQQAEIWAKGWWNKYATSRQGTFDKRPLIQRGISNVKLEVKYIEHETWCLSWFSHYTYNTHLSDKDLLASFHRFVTRKRSDQAILDLGPNHPAYIEAKEQGKYLHCLMGADDYWRWKGPCRCEDCKKFGLTRIDH